MKFAPRQYQEEIAEKAYQVLLEKKITCLYMEMRTGKTITAFRTLEKVMDGKPQNIFSVLFLTKKKAIKSIEADYELMGCKFRLKVINYESLHKVDLNWTYHEQLDFIVCDECQTLGTYPKPNNKVIELKKLLKDKTNTSILYITGTPSPESYSQLYHQFQITTHSPWSEYKTFYKWCADYVDVTQKRINGFMVNNYSNARKDKILKDIESYVFSYTQSQAGFENKVQEMFHEVEMSGMTKEIIKRLKKDKVVKSKISDEVILADTAVKEMQKVHQLGSGTCKFESGNAKVIDDSKVEYLKCTYPNNMYKKVAIMYVFQAEGKALKEAYPNWTDSPETFKEEKDAVFIGQIRSSREGVNLSCADILIMYNIEFSSLSYLQGRERLATKDRSKQNKVLWLFSDCGIERKIYETVKEKRDYTLSHYRGDSKGTKRIVKEITQKTLEL